MAIAATWGSRLQATICRRCAARTRYLEGWFGQGLLTRPSSATAVPDRRRVTWQPSVGRTAGVWRPAPNERPNGGVGRPAPNETNRNESSPDQRAVKTNFAACHARPAKWALPTLGPVEPQC